MSTPSTGTITGTIATDSGAPCSGALVYSTPASSSVFSDSLGHYTLPNLNSGDYVVHAAKSGYDSVSVTVNVRANIATTANLVLRNPFSGKSPNRPLYSAPDSASVMQAGSVITLRWSCTDPLNDALNYDVYLSNSSSPDSLKLVASRISATSYTFTLASNPTTYLWKVIARNSKYLTTSGPIWSFQTTEPPPVNYDLHFDGLSQYAYVDSNTDFNLSGGDYTIELWVYIDSGNPQWQVILAKDNTNSQTDYLIQANGTRKFLFQSRNTSNMLYSTSQFKDSTWYHIAVQQSVSDSKVRLFINGKLDAEATLAGNPVTTSNPLVIGTRINSASGGIPSSSFKGMLDDVRIFKSVRTPDQISNDMYSSVSSSTPGLVSAWSFSEGVGTTSADAGAFGYTLILMNNPKWSIH